jgi:hypothetical protein
MPQSFSHHFLLFALQDKHEKATVILTPLPAICSAGQGREVHGHSHHFLLFALQDKDKKATLLDNSKDPSGVGIIQHISSVSK